MANIIPFKVSARTARLIGRENVATSKGAIIELVKNGYDADSPFCVVLVDNKYEPTLKSKVCLKCLYFTKIISALCCYLEYFSYLYTIN